MEQKYLPFSSQKVTEIQEVCFLNIWEKSDRQYQQFTPALPAKSLKILLSGIAGSMRKKMWDARFICSFFADSFINVSFLFLSFICFNS